MSKIVRYDGSFPPFARDFQSQERTSFGTEDVGVDTLDGNINSFYLRGWGIIGPSEFPPIQYFNALGFTLSQAIAYLHQQGVPEWNASQEYFVGSLAQAGGRVYIARTGDDETPNTGNDPEADDGTNWRAMPNGGAEAVEHATDAGTDEYESEVDTSAPEDGYTIRRDFQDGNETATPELDGVVCTTRNGSELWPDALNGVHKLRYVSSTPAWRVLDPNNDLTNRRAIPTVTADGVLARHKNLRVRNGSAAASQLRTTADEMEVYDANGVPRVLSSVDVTADITASGENGLDTGSEASDTWYHKWVIHNPSTQTTAGLLSATDTRSGLTLPSGYTEIAYVGAIYNDNSSDFIEMEQLGVEAACEILTALNTSSPPNETWTSFSLTLPPTANVGLGYASVSNDSASGDNLRWIQIQPYDGGASSVGRIEISSTLESGEGSNRAASPFSLLLANGITANYRVNSDNSTAVVNITGWRF